MIYEVKVTCSCNTLEPELLLRPHIRMEDRYDTAMTDGSNSFVLPPASDAGIPGKGTRLLPADVSHPGLIFGSRRV